MRIAVTGAAGIVGREVVRALEASHELRLVDCQPVAGQQTLLADISKLPADGDPHAWTDAFAGADVVVHLAEDPRPESDWQRVLHNNIVGTWNVLWTAAEQGVRRVVYASSHWAVHLLQLESGSSLADGSQIGTRVMPRPDTPYGAAKVGGETLGRMLVDTGKLQSFVAVRVGWYHPAPPDTERYRQYGMSGSDVRHLFQRCVEAEFAGFHTVYGTSNISDGPFDMSDTCRLLDWEPAGGRQGVQ
jgi:nucleoside-diphosphate-sugar epimerase